MRRFSVQSKLLLVSAMFGLVTLLLLGHMVSLVSELRIRRDLNERAGVDVLQPAYQLQVALLQQRGRLRAGQDAGELKGRIDSLVSQLSEREASFAALLEQDGGADQAGRQWSELRSALSSRSDLQEVEAALVALREFQDFVGEHSDLALDPELESYRFARTLTELLPQLADVLAELQETVSASGPTGKATQDEQRVRLELLRARLQAELQDGESHLREHDPSFDNSKTMSALGSLSAQLEQQTETASTGPEGRARANTLEALTRCQELFGEVSASLDTLIEKRIAINKTDVTRIVIVAVLGFVLLSLAVLSVVRSIGKALRRAVDVSNRLATGDLSVQIEARSNDEIGDLQNAMLNMTANLTEMAQTAERIAAGDLRVEVRERSAQDVLGLAFRKMVEHQRSVLQELVRGVGELSSAAAELVASSTQQSASTAEQSSALQQMSSTLDELRAIVHQASDKARSVVGVSEHSLTVSESGQQAVEVALGSMHRIHEQIESVTHSILDLSAKTQQIGEITESVRDIAEQSNLLAVNAAVEAAKAGEAGRGFGVVAVEVKSLATQSKKATGTVRSILNEIQQATTSTVMGIEEGNKRVQAGVSGVQQVGDDIRQLYGIIEEACDASRQIASVAHQQVTGIEQIALAVKSIAEVSREMVSATRQQNSTAQGLSSLASSINGIVKQYKLPERP